LLLLLAAAALAACGFQPLYGQRQSGRVSADLARVDVAPIPDRIGQQLRNELLVRINPTGSPDAPRYRLQVELREEPQGLLVERDDVITRVNLRLHAEFVLVNLEDQSQLVRGRVRSMAAYNITGQQYANLVAEQDAKRRAALAVADQIAARLAAHFSQEHALRE
jgi:LPS-assembly lipoprotein